jgi:FkbM family methyltransferase
MNIASRAVSVIRRDGLGPVIHRRLNWYRDRLKGTIVALKGNRIYMDGMTYSVEPFSSTLKCTLSKGRFEEPERELVRRWLPAEIPVVELGGGMGAVSCLANRKLSDPAQHIVVEANPGMVPLLERNRDLNGCGFFVVNAALGYDSRSLTLDLDPDFVGSSASGAKWGNGTFTVRTATVSDMMAQRGFGQCGIICDIEGAEADLIERELPKLGACVRYLLAEFHRYILGAQRTQSLFNALREMGFVEKQTIGICAFFSRE